MSLPDISHIEFINLHTHNQDASSDTLSILNIFPENFNANQTNDESLFYSIGMHPWYIDEADAEKRILEIAESARNDNVLAIGETGLDKACKTNFDLQLKYFHEQVKIAEEVKKPVIIHCVRSYYEILELRLKTRPNMPWIFHGYNGNTETTKQLLNHDFYFSFGKSLEFNDKMKEVLKLIPDNALFLENDDSEIPVKKIYKQAACIRNQEMEELKGKIKSNFIRLFK